MVDTDIKLTDGLHGHLSCLYLTGAELGHPGWLLAKCPRFCWQLRCCSGFRFRSCHRYATSAGSPYPPSSFAALIPPRLQIVSMTARLLSSALSSPDAVQPTISIFVERVAFKAVATGRIAPQPTGGSHKQTDRPGIGLWFHQGSGYPRMPVAKEMYPAI